MTRPFAWTLSLVFALSFALPGCSGDPEPIDPAAGAPTPATAEPAPAVEPVELEDVVETTSDYIIGISYPPGAERYPGLAAELKRFADDTRAELLDAIAERGEGSSEGLYDLSLTFTEVLDSPQMVAVAADGSMYTGGAHAAPILARFVWLPRQQRMLRAQDLVPSEDGWEAISAHVREQLHTALSQRMDADKLPSDQRAEVVRTAGSMIDEGTGASARNFGQFEPVARPDGTLSGLRFVFPPYQVGPYSDGTQSVQVPSAVLLPHVAREYQPLFADS
ncbi:RsiV family protein [Lysobacter sp. A3-1-A15]|uniref:RsiV family protein n=1 Tax=Novilysobacter viscosus TaxID=3098602 RepID=UPI002ED77F44